MKFDSCCIGTKILSSGSNNENNKAKEEVKQDDYRVDLSMHNVPTEEDDKPRRPGDEAEQNQLRLHNGFFSTLSLCHDCVANAGTGPAHFQGSSPDEVTLLEYAHESGYSFIDSSESIIRTNVHGKEHTCEILHRLEFSSDRRRMSVLLCEVFPNQTAKGPAILLTKGADSVILQRLRNVHSVDEEKSL